jgi:membrane-bound lytic murein transglycosylase D
MAGEAVVIPQTKAWLVARSGPQAGTRYLLPAGATRIGRAADNDIVIQGPQTAIVSLNHLEIVKSDAGYRIHDLGSTNGTFLNGERITEIELSGPATIRLGNDGPEFAFTTEEVAPSELDRTLVIPEGVLLPTPPEPPSAAVSKDEALLSEAVRSARRARAEGIYDQTLTLMRDALHLAMQRSHRRFRVIIGVLVVALLGTSAFGYWKIAELKRAKSALDRQIEDVQTRLEKANQEPERERLYSELSDYQSQAVNLERSLFYRVGIRENESFVTRQIREVMGEFGAEVYSIPPQFSDAVNEYINRYQGPDRPLMERALSEASGKIDTMRQILKEEELPPDFAWVPLVESALAPNPASSPSGASGPWQFTAATARAYGLRVDGEVDERNNLRKATRAGCKYLRDLILDFGAGSSVMLALAAYNIGPGKVKQAVQKTVKDPIKQRNFWYLYHIRALPAETREYVPKVFAAILIGRNPGYFGF